MSRSVTHIPFLSSLRFKIGFGYIVLVLINVAVIAWSIYNFARLNLALNTILGENYPNVIAVENMARSIRDHEDAISMMLNRDPNNGRIRFTEAKDEFYQWFQRANENRTVPDADAILSNTRSTYEGYMIVTDSLMTIIQKKDYVTAKALYVNIVRPFSERLTDNCFWLIEENQKEMLKVGEQTKQLSDEAILAVLIAAVMATGLSILTMVQFTRRIIEPAERLTDTVHQIGRGRLDLKIDIETNDEVGTLSREFNKMTERLRRFEELNVEKIISEKHKSETIVESISDAILVVDSESSIQLMNHSAEVLFGVREEDAVGASAYDCIRDERIRKILHSPGDPALVNQPFLLFNREGKQAYFRARVTQIPSQTGQRGGVVVVLQDVTQFKQLDKMKSDFMAAVSHEFRTPLTSINMGVDIIRQRLLGPLSDGQEELLRSAKQDCDRLTKLVRELLQLSKLESGKLETRDEVIDIGGVIASTLDPLQIQFREKGVRLDIDVEQSLPKLTGNEQQFSWVISNLVNNALRYTDTGGVVTVNARRCKDDILMQVTDTGRGIAPEHLDKIFDKFVQIKKGGDTTPGSVGLGLAIAKEVVELYGGSIWAESTPGKGSVFNVRFPAGREVSV